MAIIAKSLFFGPKAQKIITNGIVLYFDAGNSSSYSGSGTTLIDLSGNSINGTLINGVGYSSSSLVFDGINDYVETNSVTLDVSSGYTAIMVAKWNNFNGGSFRINQPLMYINFYSGGDSRLRWETYAGNSMRTNAPLPNDRFVFVAGTYGGVSSFGATAIAKTYINGVLDNTSVLASGPSITGQFVIGEYAGNMNGLVSYLLFYNRELNATEILQNFNAMKGRFGL